jgi:hypothetical protein
VASGCGGVESEPNLAQAIERTEAVGSSRLELKGVQTSDGKPSAFTCAGDADYAAKSVHVDCDYADLGKFEAIAIGKDLYMRGDWLAGFATDGKWLKQTGELGDDSLANLSPERLLAMLRAASSETVRIGEEDVRGVSTVRYRLTVDCEKAELDCQGTAPVEVWIDEDGLVRRIALNDDGAEGTIEFFDFGAEVSIEPPAADEILRGGTQGSAGVTVTPSDASCTGKEAAPVTESLARRTLADHGLVVSTEEGLCDMAVGLQNGAASMFVCTVHPGSGSVPGSLTLSDTGQSVSLAVHNFECIGYGDGPAFDEVFERLQQANDDLEQAIGP